jgi:Flp pilus assembly protein TadG
MESLRNVLRSIRSGRLKRILRLASEERGSAYLLFAILVVPVFVGFVAVITEMGMALEVRRQLQTVTDAAALAGAQDLPGSPFAAADVAYEYVNRNSTSLPTLTNSSAADVFVGTSFSANDTITVTAVATVPLTLMPLLGYANVQSVGATATAAIGSIGGDDCVLPLSIVTTTHSLNAGLGYPMGTQLTIKIGTDDAEAGNFQALDIYGNGANGIRDAIANVNCSGAEFTNVGEVLTTYTKPGNMVGPIDQGFDDRITGVHRLEGYDDVVLVDTAEDGTITYTVLHDCPRVVIVPIVFWNDPNGKKEVTVLGFALFFVENWEKSGGNSSVTGRFISTTVPGGPWIPYNGLSKVVRLIR